MDKKIAFSGIVILLILLLILGSVILLYVFGFLGGEVKYICPDGTFVTSPDECPTTTTMLITTTEIVTTTTPTTRVITTTTIGTTTTTFACTSDSDCGINVNSTPYCSDNHVKIDVLKPVCLNPKRVNAKCAMTPTGITHVIQTCNPLRELCLQGVCMPRTCANGRYDPDEKKIDCGGVCPKPCDLSSILCKNDSDCGEMKCSREYYCLETNTAYNCYFSRCVDGGTNYSRCVDANTTLIKDFCSKSEHCEDGWGLCREGGTCRDCVRNQDEVKVDCGGQSCQPCVTIPETYNTLSFSGSNSFRVEYTDKYDSIYLFFLDKIFKDKCPYGARVRLDKNGVVVASAEVDIYSDAMLSKFNIGLLDLSTGSATIWVREPE